MRATELIQRLQQIVAEHGDHRVSMSTVGEFSTARVESVRFVNGDNKGAPGVYAILISDYQA